MPRGVLEIFPALYLVAFSIFTSQYFILNNSVQPSGVVARLLKIASWLLCPGSCSSPFIRVPSRAYLHCKSRYFVPNICFLNHGGPPLIFCVFAWQLGLTHNLLRDVDTRVSYDLSVFFLAEVTYAYARSLATVVYFADNMFLRTRCLDTKCCQWYSDTTQAAYYHPLLHFT